MHWLAQGIQGVWRESEGDAVARPLHQLDVVPHGAMQQGQQGASVVRLQASPSALALALACRHSHSTGPAACRHVARADIEHCCAAGAAAGLPHCAISIMDLVNCQALRRHRLPAEVLPRAGLPTRCPARCQML